MFQRILAALDNSEASQPVFEEAVEIAKTNHAGLMLLHVVSPMDEGYPTPIYFAPDSLYPMQHDTLFQSSFQSSIQQSSAIEKLGLEMLRSRHSTATAAGVPTEFNQSIGEPGAMICKVAKSWQADLIVMGRRGRSGLTELLLGSVSNYVMHHAPCSVLVVQDALVAA